VVSTAYVVFRITLRFVYFIDDPHPKHWPVIRHWRAWRERFKQSPTYSHDTLSIDDELKAKIIALLGDAGKCDLREELGLRSLAVAIEHQGQANALLVKLAETFLERGFSVQYLTASRHPIELVAYLRSNMNDATWAERRKQIVTIDAFTPHFGFIDSIYRRKARELEKLDVHYIMSGRTFAGVHTAASKAFNQIKVQLKKDHRQPTLVIYEDTYALADLESPEQYRIFVRHVLPSERMWDGMFTAFVESAQPEADWRVLQCYASIRIDFRDGEVRPKARTRRAGTAEG